MRSFNLADLFEVVVDACPDRVALVTPTGRLTYGELRAAPVHGGGQWITWITFTTGGTVVLWTDRHFDARGALEPAARERTQILMLVGNAMAQPIVEELVAGSYDLEVFAFGSGGAPAVGRGEGAAAGGGAGRVRLRQSWWVGDGGDGGLGG